VRAASVLSTHPVVAIALGEAAGQVLEALDGAGPSLVLVTVTPPHLGTLEDVGSALRALLAPEVVLGAVAPAVVGGGRHVAGGPALALFALAGVDASALSLVPDQGTGLRRVGRLDGAAAAVVLADPFSCRPADLLGAMADVPSGGGLVGGAKGPGGSRLLLDGAVRTSGAVGAFLGPPAAAVASQGATPTGEAWAVTRSVGDEVLEIGGRPAADRRRQALGEDQPGALGLLLDEHAEEAGRAELLAVPILGSGPTGGLRLGRSLPVGRVVRFLRTGPVEAEADLAAALSSSPPAASTGVLLFPADGREGDADLISELLGCPVGGAAVSAPLAPVGGMPSLHGPGATGLVVFP
jgi:small ligand-binding sensory domain FIST